MKCKICKNKTKTWYKKLFDDRHGYPGYFNVEKCVECGFAQTDPQIPKNKLTELYSKYYPRQNIDFKKIKLKNYKSPKRSALWRKGLLNGAHFLVKDDSSVLDVGSGVGYSLLYLKNKGCEAYGIDPDSNAKKLAKKFKLNFHQGFIEDRPFENKKFDYVIANQVIEHTNNPVGFLKHCKNRLKKDGEIIISFPNANSLTRKLLGKKWLHWHIPYHLNHFSKKSVAKLAKKTNLKIKTIKTITPNLWTNIQIRNLLAKPEMGKRDFFWDGKSNKEEEIKHIGFLNKTFRILENYNFLNRVVDKLQFGESFLVILKP